MGPSRRDGRAQMCTAQHLARPGNQWQGDTPLWPMRDLRHEPKRHANGRNGVQKGHFFSRITRNQGLPEATHDQGTHAPECQVDATAETAIWAARGNNAWQDAPGLGNGHKNKMSRDDDVGALGSCAAALAGRRQFAPQTRGMAPEYGPGTRRYRSNSVLDRNMGDHPCPRGCQPCVVQVLQQADLHDLVGDGCLPLNARGAYHSAA